MKYIFLFLLIACANPNSSIPAYNPGPPRLLVECYKDAKLLYKETVYNISVRQSENGEIVKYDTCIITELK